MTREEFEKLRDDLGLRNSSDYIDFDELYHGDREKSGCKEASSYRKGFSSGADFAWPIIERLEREVLVLREALIFYGNFANNEESYKRILADGGDKALHSIIIADQIRKGEL